MAVGASPDSDVERAVTVVRERIRAACARAGRAAGDVTLIGATKAVPVAIVLRARKAGLEHFGENYAKDLAAKAQAVRATWHFIGKVQAGNAAKVARFADVIHSGEPGRGLPGVARRAAAAGRTIPCLVQVDFTGRRQGTAPGQVLRFVEEASGLEGIALAGFMTIPPLTADPAEARPYFRRLRDLRDQLARTWPGLQELSMGMSTDFEIAVEEGATMVRVGTALFGERPWTGPPTGSVGAPPG